MKLNSYLFFNGNCKEAFEFYEECLGGKIVAIMDHSQAPMDEPCPPEWKDKILHAVMVVQGQAIMGSDSPPEYYAKPQGFTVSVSVDAPDEAERIFGALAEGGAVSMPIAETFWAQRFGMVTDRFGIPWMVNCEKPMPPR